MSAARIVPGWRHAVLGVLCALGWQGAAAAGNALAPFAMVGGEPVPPWRWSLLPHQTKPVTRFSVGDFEGKHALRVEADKSYGNLAQDLHFTAGAAPPHLLSWQWRVEELNMASDLRKRSGDDTTLKLCAMFELPLDRVPFVERQLLRLMRARSSEPMPSASVCYVWDAHLSAGTELPNAFTKRVRYIVLESGAAHLHQWVAERRDVAADFLRLFGDESQVVPALVGVAVGADADNTQQRSLAYVAELALE
ncbi:MAG TPA: DUF3047 domain-containing protein [Methylibium sp.]